MDKIGLNRDKLRFKHSKDVVLTINQNDKIIKFNKECENIFGYKETEVLNKSLFNLLISKRFQSQWKNLLDAARSDEHIEDFKLPMITHGGRELLISWSCFPVKSLGNIGLVGEVIDELTVESESPVEIKTPKPTQTVLSEDYFEKFEEIVNDLKKKNDLLEKKNKSLEKKLLKKEDKNLLIPKEKVISRGIYRMSDFFGSKKHREELNALMKELDQREKYLNKLEAKINKDKNKINTQREEFVNWRKKLELLESDVESRIRWVEKKEDSIEKATSELDESLIDKMRSETATDYEPGYVNNMADCAAVVQRGVFREVNSFLAELLGYNIVEIVDKSIFDFIGPDGFSGIETYYFNKLKGSEVTSFNTKFLTKDNDLISVEVNAKPTFFNGEKAEIIVFKKQEIKKDK